MVTEQVTQIVEAIKTLNLNIDSDTLVEVTKTIIPYFYFSLAKDFVIAILGIIGAIVAVCIVTKVFKIVIKKAEREQ